MSGESVTFAPVKSRAHGIEPWLRFSNVAESQYNTNIVHMEEVTFLPLVKKAVTPSFGSKNKQNLYRYEKNSFNMCPCYGGDDWLCPDE